MDSFIIRLRMEIKAKRKAFSGIKGDIGYVRSKAFIEGMEAALASYTSYIAEQGSTVTQEAKERHSKIDNYEGSC